MTGENIRNNEILFLSLRKPNPFISGCIRHTAPSHTHEPKTLITTSRAKQPPKLTLLPTTFPNLQGAGRLQCTCKFKTRTQNKRNL